MIKDEHFDPINGLDLSGYIQNGDMAGVHHLIRYLWALEVVSGWKRVRGVLDVACGAGYGSYLLAQKFPKIQVLGVDYDSNAVDTANRSYQLPNLKYLWGDVT